MALTPPTPPTPLKIVNCIVTPTAALVYFSQPLVNPTPASGGSFVVRRANPALPQIVNLSAVFDPATDTATLQLDPAAALKVGELISIQGTGIVLATGAAAATDIFFVKVNGQESQSEANARRTTQAAEDSVAYPIMTESVGTPPASSYGSGSEYGGGGSAAGSLQLSQLATQTITNVLGWKPKDGDAKGFVGALTQSFSLQDVEGHTEATWTPRTYAVQTDLSGGITGAQASLYMRANGALQQSSPLLDGLYALNPDSDAEMVTALKDIVSSQFNELVNELGYAGGPRISRVNQYFQLLLGGPPIPNTASTGFSVVSDPDQIQGTLGRLRDELQLQSFSHYVNTIEDEQDVTNYRILSDYLTSLAQSWVNNVGFFGLDTKQAFLGTQLVLLSRQLSVIGETVGEVRFALDSVFIGPSERQTLQLEFASGEPAIFIEDILSWTEAFAKDEGPQLIQNAGKLGVGDGFLPVVDKLVAVVTEARHPQNEADLPDGYRTIRVRHALKDLQDQLGELSRMAGDVSLQDPPKVFDYDEIMNTIQQVIKDQVKPESLKKMGMVQKRA
jgi:hypothetical protein